MAQDLTDAQWAFIKPLLPELPQRPDGRGRPWRDSREVFNGILWILRTGAQWSEMPPRYPPYQTCHRRFQQWRQSGVMDRLLKVLAQDLEGRGKINLEECFVDGSFSAAKKGALRRWKVERLFAWLQNYRRLVTRFEYHVENFLAFLKLAAFMILAKKYL